MANFEERNRQIAEFIGSFGDGLIGQEQQSFLLTGGDGASTNVGTNCEGCINKAWSCSESVNGQDCKNYKGFCGGASNGKGCLNDLVPGPSTNMTENCKG